MTFRSTLYVFIRQLLNKQKIKSLVINFSHWLYYWALNVCRTIMLTIMCSHPPKAQSKQGKTLNLCLVCWQLQDSQCCHVLSVPLQQYLGSKPFCAVLLSVCLYFCSFVSLALMWAYSVGELGGGSPSWTVIISKVGCQRAAMTARLCGCWRGAITLKSLVWQTFGVCLCRCYISACVCVWLYI